MNNQIPYINPYYCNPFNNFELIHKIEILEQQINYLEKKIQDIENNNYNKNENNDMHII